MSTLADKKFNCNDDHVGILIFILNIQYLFEFRIIRTQSMGPKCAPLYNDILSAEEDILSPYYMGSSTE